MSISFHASTSGTALLASCTMYNPRLSFCGLYVVYVVSLWRSFVTTELGSLLGLKNRHGHRLCWMSMGKKNGLMRRTHSHVYRSHSFLTGSVHCFHMNIWSSCSFSSTMGPETMKPRLWPTRRPICLTIDHSIHLVYCNASHHARLITRSRSFYVVPGMCPRTTHTHLVIMATLFMHLIEHAWCTCINNKHQAYECIWQVYVDILNKKMDAFPQNSSLLLWVVCRI